MKDMGIRQGSSAWAVPVIATNDTIYVHADIEQITEMNGEPVTDCWRYHEIQYTSKEYIELIGKENVTLKSQMETTQEVLDFLLLV
jgi:hypothetical protein